jgi:UDP-MurNAc hydroxylase
MRFTVIGHACLFIEVGNSTILVDPWLSGSCYWRSWWHFPPNTPILDKHLCPDFIYLSHYHFDHFHFPSMRRLSKKATVLIPKFAIDAMKQEVQNLGFKKIIEVEHGHTVEMADGARMASFQYGFDDSALVVAHNGDVLIDLNDSKVKGHVAKQLIREFGQPTFVLKSHSWAQAYPNCYSADDPGELALLNQRDYAQSFIATIRELSPRYAVPFASMVGFLHPDTKKYNAHAVTPHDVEAVFNDTPGTEHTVLKVMAPGDSWDSSKGFTISLENQYLNRDRTLAQLASEVFPSLEMQQSLETGSVADFNMFKKYFHDFIKALPLGVRFFFKRTVVFHLTSSSSPYWVIDIRNSTIKDMAMLPPGWGSLISIPDAVLMDAIQKRIVNFVHISLRISIRLAAGGVKVDFPFWGFLTLYELGYFPIRKMLSMRALRVYWLRRLEIWQVLSSLLSRRSLAESMVGTLMTREQKRADHL